MNITLVEAISKKKRIAVTYNGTERVCEPHAYGLDKNGAPKLRVFQIAESEEHQGWRLLRGDAITEVKVLDQSFDKPQDGYKRDDQHIPDIFAQL